ncbi:MAG: alcohol dehydrogenase catalytic domain-containing protein [Xanthomonadaceae bacterium]|nr:alcohol dehydrogenase catalytic domain-containing protein [Xanthomonadaceae bacterium]
MKAAIYKNYGSPDVVQIAEIPNPKIKKNEILVMIFATTVNRNDCGFRKPEYAWIIRPIHGLLRPRIQVLGTEFSGVVLETGSEVTNTKKGDEIFGLTGNQFGCHAEYLAISENSAFAFKPNHLKHEEAVSILDGPWLAHSIINSFDQIKTKRILVYGASGSIGSACVELAKSKKFYVTAVSRSTL